MNKIYQCEDAIEQAKFLLAALKIETAFDNIHQLTLKKHHNFYQTFLFKLKLTSNRRLIAQVETSFYRFEQLVQTFQHKRKRNAFHKLLGFLEKQQRTAKSKAPSLRDKQEHLRSSDQRSQIEYRHSGVGGGMTMSLIEEEGWRDKMSLQELQASCDYYSCKIKQVEKSFSDFFQHIKRSQ